MSLAVLLVAFAGATRGQELDLPQIGGAYVAPVYPSGSTDTRSFVRLHNASNVDGEAVSCQGIIENGKKGTINNFKTVTHKAKVLWQKTLSWQGEVTNLFWIATGKVMAGMSGGPVIADEDGKFAGIVMGQTASSNLRKLFGFKRYAVFVPFQTIQASWESC